MISSIGGSNLDILMNSLRRLEEEPIRKLETRKSGISQRMSLFSDFKSKLNSLKTIIKELGYSGTTSVFGKKAATSSDENVLTVTAESTATATTHTILVQQLAKADKIVSSQYTLTDTTIPDGTHTFDVTVNGVTTSVSVTIDAADDNEAAMNKIVAAVNSTTDVGIRASVIKDTATTGRLVFTSQETGADYEMTLSDTSGSLLSTLGLNDSVAAAGTTGGYVYDTTELNATAIVDGITVQSNSNTLEDVIAGLTINLKKTQAAAELPVTIKAENDVEGIKGKIESFINAYNEVLDFIKQNTSTSATVGTRSPLSGDFSISNFRIQLRQLVTEPVTGLPAGDPTILAAFGIETDRTGKLTLKDSTKLENGIRDNIGQLEQLFNLETNGLSDKIVNLVETMTGGSGIIEKRRDVLQSQINTINQRIDRMKLSVDKKLEYYRSQFAQMQAAFAQFQSQSAYISTLSQSSFIGGSF